MTYRGFAIDVIHSNRFTYIHLVYKTMAINGELKIVIPSRSQHPNARIFTDGTRPQERKRNSIFLVALKLFPRLDFSVNIILSDAAFRGNHRDGTT